MTRCSRSTDRLRLVSLLALGLLAAPGAAAQGGQATVGVYDNLFVPSEVVVPVGGTVVWTTYQSLHNSVGEGGLWDSGLLVRPASFQRVFDQPGRYRYVCTLHSGMQGTVIVLAPGGAAPPAGAPAARPQGRPRISIVEPADGATLATDDVRVRVQVEDFVLDPTGLAAPEREGGHWHLLVDGGRLQVLVGEEAVLPPLPPGPHTLEAQLRRHDHSRVEGAAPARASFTLLAPTSDAAGGAGVPIWLIAVPLALLVGGLLLARPYRGLRDH